MTQTTSNIHYNNIQSQCRRKGIGVKEWMMVTETGQKSLKEVEKYYIMRRTGLPGRDLRVLDPLLSHPSSILGRERAIVVNLEHIKAIITAKEVLMINSSNPLFICFLQDLLTRLPFPTNRTPAQKTNTKNCYEVNPLSGGTGSPNLLGWSNSNNDRNNSPVRMLEDSDVLPGRTSNVDSRKWGNNPKTADDHHHFGAQPHPKQQLPFEFRALEACLDSACRCLESEVRTLEEEAYPALDELTSHISTLNLERVRQIKSRLVQLSGRVQKVKDLLENLLDDDNDMAEMYLTHKLDARLKDQASLKERLSPTFEDDEDQRDEEFSEKSGSSSNPKVDVEELEMLLEAYFAQINGSLQKLSSLSEYVDDTEDCINISLDEKRNQLLQVAVIFDTLTIILSAGIVVVGLFGMNIHIDLYDGDDDDNDNDNDNDTSHSSSQFWPTVAATFAACLLLSLFSVWWCKRKYLFQL